MTENAKKKIISRQEAADMLGVRPQSISNYAEHGLIRTVHSKTNNFVYFLYEDVEALLPHIAEIKDREQTVNEYKEALKKEEASYRNVLQERSRLLRISRLSVSYTKQLIEDCYCFLQGTEDTVPVKVLLRVLRGEDTSKLEKELQASNLELVKVCRQAMETLRLLPNYEEMYEQNASLRSELNTLTVAYKYLCDQYAVLKLQYKDATEPGWRKGKVLP